uniref:Uncharacterized protein n=1 Tax=viral metagenome TaxID=1070528 RepID=A0A6C0EQI5_9ZZZZ
MSTQAERFASCVKQITKNFRPASLKRGGRSASKRSASFSNIDKEGVAIAICTKSILWPQGRTIKRFYMKKGKPILITQKRKKRLPS